jgi:threonine dehydratase
VGSPWPITLGDVEAARERLTGYLRQTPLRQYAPLDHAVGRGIAVVVKHENHNPTNAFKVRNGLAALTAMGPAELSHGVAAATRGNHGLGLAYAGSRLGVPVVICVPVGNNPEKNEAMAGYGAKVIETGRDYDDAAAAMRRIAAERGLTLVHGTNHAAVLAGAGTITQEILEQEPDVDAIVIAIGGGSQAVGALTVVRALKPSVKVFGVQAAGASAIHDGWYARRPTTTAAADTFADGIATRSTYELTFGALCEGLAGFVTVTDAEIADALRLLLATTHNLAEGAGAAGLAGLLKLRDDLAGMRVAVILSGANIDAATLKRVVNREI